VDLDRKAITAAITGSSASRGTAARRVLPRARQLPADRRSSRSGDTLRSSRGVA